MNDVFYYTYINTQKATYSPSEINIKNTSLYEFYRRYLLQKMISIFKWNLPQNWSRNYFLYGLYAWGFLAVIRTDKYGVIPQVCGLQGYNVFYQPTHVNIANPRLQGLLTPEIGKQCELIKLQPDYGSALDIVSYFAEQMTLTSEAISSNIINSKLAYVFASESKSAAESFKRLYDNIAAGEPAAFVDKKLFREDGDPNWMTFANHLRENYIAGDLLQELQKWEYRFDTIVGIPNANTDKRERLIVDEVNANNAETRAVSEIWLETLQDDLEKVRKMFDLTTEELDVRRREEEVPEDDQPEQRDLNLRPVSV